MPTESRDVDPLTAGDSQALAAFKLPLRLSYFSERENP
jgi:hypothetical protein